MSLDQELEIGSQILEGLTYLQETNHVHGDLKPENIFVYLDAEGRPFVRISDFGKAKQLNNDNVKLFRNGNPSYSSPENKLTKKSEVYCAALMIIRLLENKYLTEEHSSLIEVPKEKQKDKPDERRKGVEKYLVEHPDCKQYNEWGRTNIVATVMAPFAYAIGVKGTPASQTAIHNYIDRLKEKLKNETSFENIEGLIFLLKRMTLSDRQARPTMEEALNQYQKFQAFMKEAG